MKVPTPGADEGPGTGGSQRPGRLRRALLAWYRGSARDLRFRGARDPWAILVSEVMAQQTQVARVEAAWVAFMRRFPTPAALAEAPTSEALLAWAGLGYNRRAVLLQRAARAIVDRHAGSVPERLADLEALPGVGPYTARAVAAIAFGHPAGAVDTNVRRVVSRLLGRPDASGPEVQACADALVDAADPATWTHALMDLGATVCLVRKPLCGACPLRPWCLGAEPGMPDAGGRPVRARRTGGRRSQRHAGVPFEHTTRWLRGRIVAHLRELEPGVWTHLPAVIGRHDSDGIGLSLEALERDGLIERRADGAVRLPSTHP